MDNKEKRDEVTMEIRNLLMETIMRYCFKSKGGVEMTLILKALAEVIAAHLAVTTQDWTEEQTADVVDSYLNYIVKTVKECREEPDSTDEGDKLVKDILNLIGKAYGEGN